MPAEARVSPPAQRYAVYGLTVACDAELEGIPAAAPGASVDVTVHFTAAAPWDAAPGAQVRYRSAGRPDAGADALVVDECDEGFVHRYADGATFHLARDASTVWVTVPAAMPLSGAAVYLIGPVLGFVLRLRGVLCLHASGVVVEGRAVALLGAPGAGKSTAAAAFARAGHPVIADDLVPLRHDGDAWWALPSVDHLRVWPDAAPLLFDEPVMLPRVSPDWDKRRVVLGVAGTAPRADAAPLAAVIVLGPRASAADAPTLVPATDAGVALALVAQTYANYLLDARQRADELAQIGALLQRVPAYRGTIPASRTGLRQFVALVADALATGAATP